MQYRFLQGFKWVPSSPPFLHSLHYSNNHYNKKTHDNIIYLRTVHASKPKRCRPEAHDACLGSKAKYANNHKPYGPEAHTACPVYCMPCMYWEIILTNICYPINDSYNIWKKNILICIFGNMDNPSKVFALDISLHMCSSYCQRRVYMVLAIYDDFDYLFGLYMCLSLPDVYFSTYVHNDSMFALNIMVGQLYLYGYINGYNRIGQWSRDAHKTTLHHLPGHAVYASSP